MKKFSFYVERALKFHQNFPKQKRGINFRGGAGVSQSTSSTPQTDHHHRPIVCVCGGQWPYIFILLRGWRRRRRRRPSNGGKQSLWNSHLLKILPKTSTWGGSHFEFEELSSEWRAGERSFSSPAEELKLFGGPLFHSRKFDTKSHFTFSAQL